MGWEIRKSASLYPQTASYSDNDIDGFKKSYLRLRNFSEYDRHTGKTEVR